jgi:hypothetical protein
MKIQEMEKEIHIDFEGGDFLDGTPVIDIKPYIPYADCIPDAVAAWASQPPTPHLRVEWSGEAITDLKNITDLKEIAGGEFERLYRIITDVIGHDPRPFHHRFDTQKPTTATKLNTWNFHFDNVKVFFSVALNVATVSAIELAANQDK